jgi:hypothetical protein
MFFALADWLKYRLRRGVYGDDPSKNIMAIGHEGEVASETLALLQGGEIIICQRMDSVMSWAIMYFGGGYAIDHVAIYVGEENVIHATFSGTKIQALRALAQGARILPFQPHWLSDDSPPAGEHPSPRTSPTESERQGSDDPHPDGSDQPTLPPHLQLFLVGIQIVFGLSPTSFRWRYYADVGFCAAMVDLILWPINQFPMASTLWTAWLLVLLTLRLRYYRQLRSGHRFEPDSHPGQVLQWLMQGGHIFPGRPINGKWKVRVLPSWVAPSSLQQTTPQSPNQRSDRGS